MYLNINATYSNYMESTVNQQKFNKQIIELTFLKLELAAKQHMRMQLEEQVTEWK